MPINPVPKNAIENTPTPEAIPIAREKKMNIMSCESFITVRKRIIDNAPTIPNALARLLPITIIATDVIIESIISAFANEDEKLIPS